MFKNSLTHSINWNPRLLLKIHLFIAIGLCTLFSPVTYKFWESIDFFIFKAINSTLSWGHSWQVFWALANHKFADWLEDIVILIFAITYVRSAEKNLRTYRTAQIIFFVIYSAFIIFFVNKIIIRDWIVILRDSPSLVIDNSIKLSEHISWLKIKDQSPKSFPGDHATTAILFGYTFFYLGSKKMKICAILYAMFLVLPRMILGAHWFTDVVIGSGSIVFFFLSWIYFTPFAHKASVIIEQILHFFRFKKKLPA